MTYKRLGTMTVHLFLLGKKLTLVLVIVLLVYYYCFFRKNDDFDGGEDVVRVVNKTLSDNTKVILYWTKFWNWDYPIGVGSKQFKSCPHQNCLTTFNKSLMNLEDYHAIVFHGSIYDLKKHGKPKIRNVNQRYVYFNTEAPVNKFAYNPNFALFNSFYNWTITYRFDSDVILRYGWVEKWKTEDSPPTAKDVENKNKLVVWFASHCNTSSRREVLVNEIQRYVPVDVYGTCGNLSCSRNGYVSSSSCYDMMEKNYKFYLSFENSLCKDYFTEKLYYVLGRNIVPVVYASNDDTVLAPPHSVINVKDFKDVKQLTDYLRFLDGNVIEYLKYFEWKKDYIIANNPTICDLCSKINEPLGIKTYDDFVGWQYGTEEHPTCLSGLKLPPIITNTFN